MKFINKKVMNIDFSKHIWEGWTVKDFIDDLELTFNFVKNRLKTKADVKKWCMSEQPYYKKHIPEVVEYFYNKLNQ